MGRLTIRRSLILGAALLAGGALALPIASSASDPSPATTSTATTSTGTTSTTTTGTGTTGTGTTTTTATTTPEPAPKPPFAYTGHVEQITERSAALKARIDPEGLATEYHFQYGPTAAYGAQTPSAAAGGTTQEGKFTQAIAGLEPNTTYHFRVVASNSAGTTDGADATFTTEKTPPTLTASVTPSPAVFGRPLRFSGTVSGAGNAGVEVVLQESPFPYNHGFYDITSPEAADAAGGFSFALAGLFENTKLRAATTVKPIVYSPVTTELVAVRVTLHVRPAKRRGYVRLYGVVTPSEPGAKVAFERRQHGRYVTVGGSTVKTSAGAISRFARTVHLRGGGLVRALVKIPSGDLISGRSRPVLIH
jgi:hypothetical protein